MKVKFQIYLFFIVSQIAITFSVLGVTSFEEALEALRDSSDHRKNEAIDYFLQNENLGLVFLNNYFFPDIEELLRNLGHEKFSERQRAIEYFCSYGRKYEEKIKALYANTDDPEIKWRCKTILSFWKEQTTEELEKSEKLLNEALIVILKAKSNPPILNPFLKYYFENYNKLSETQRDLLPIALEKVKLHSDLIPSMITAMEESLDDKVFELIALSLKKMIPKQADDVISKARRNFIKRGINLAPMIKILKDNLGDTQNPDKYMVIASKIENSDPNFELKRDLVIEKMLEHSDPNVISLGVWLIKNNPANFKEKILNIVSCMHEESNNSSFFWALSRFANKNEIFEDSIDVFLDSDCYNAVDFGLDLARNNPEPYKDKIIKLMNDESRYNKFDLFSYFINHYFPDDQTLRMQELMKRLFKTSDIYEIYSLSNKLWRDYKYKGNDFDDWWLALKRNPEYKKNVWIVIHVTAYLNVNPDIVIPELDEESSFSPEALDHLFKCKDKNLREKLCDLALKSIYNKAHSPSYEVPHLIRHQPKLAAKILEATFLSQDRFSLSQLVFHDFFAFSSFSEEKFSDVVEILKKDPNTIFVLDKFLKSEKAVLRLYAVLVAEALGLNKDLWLPVLVSLPSDGNNYEMSATIIKLMLINDAQSEKVIPHIKNLAFQKDDHAKKLFNDILEYFNEKDEQYLATLEELFETFKSQDKARALLLAKSILYINENRHKVIEYLSDLTLNSDDYEFAWKALKILGEFQRDTLLPEKRLEELYVKCPNIYTVNEALKNSRVNAIAALPVIKQHIELNVNSEYSGLNELMNEFPDFEKEITPFLLDLAESGSAGERNYAIEILSSNTRYIPQHIEKLNSISKKLDSKELWDNFVWTLANTGRAAESFVPILETNYSNAEGRKKFYYYFAMARIHPDVQKRRDFTLQIIEELKKIKDESLRYSVVCILGLIIEFPELTHPVLTEIFLDKNDEARSEAAWALTRIRPFTDHAKNAFRQLMKKILKGEEQEMWRWIFLITSAYPQEFDNLLEFMEKVPKECRFIQNYNFIRRRAKCGSLRLPDQ